MESKIRKIIVGKDPLNAMAYVVGKELNYNSKIEYIELDERHLAKYNKTRYNIFIIKDSGTFLWKTIEEMPCIIEYDCDFK